MPDTRLPTHRPPTTPGEMLLEEFLKPQGLSVEALARRGGLRRRQLRRLVAGGGTVTPSLSRRLGRATGMSAGFWRQLQRNCDLWPGLPG